MQLFEQRKTKQNKEQETYVYIQLGKLSQLLNYLFQAFFKQNETNITLCQDVLLFFVWAEYLWCLNCCSDKIGKL